MLENSSGVPNALAALPPEHLAIRHAGAAQNKCRGTVAGLLARHCVRASMIDTNRSSSAAAQRPIRSRLLPWVLAACTLASLGHAQSDTSTAGGTTPPADTTGGTTPPADTTGSTTPPADTTGGTTPPADTTADTTGSTPTTGDSTSTSSGDTTNTTPPAAIVPSITVSHVDAVLTATGGSATATYQWRLNGAALEGETSSSLSIAKVAPANAGLYSVDIVDGTTTKTATTILGLATSTKIVGTATEVGSNILHQNGNTYDQVLMTGPAATVKADAGQITRVSFIDVDNDIVQVEFSGAGSVSISLANASAPAAPVNYNQPDVQYVKGNATIIVANADASTHLAVYSVGPLTAVNQALFRTHVEWDGVANIAALAIQSTDGKFGGLYAGNTNFIGTSGNTGIYAPDVTFTDRVAFSDITASDTATPVLLLGGTTEVHVAGGDLLQLNDKPVQVSGFTSLIMDAGVSSHGAVTGAQTIKGHLEEDGVDVTARAH